MEPFASVSEVDTVQDNSPDEDDCVTLRKSTNSLGIEYNYVLDWEPSARNQRISPEVVSSCRRLPTLTCL
jgi:hypothetical protein